MYRRTSAEPPDVSGPRTSQRASLILIIPVFFVSAKSSTTSSPQKKRNPTMLPKATAKVNGVVIAESDQYTTVEGNIYVRKLASPAASATLTIEFSLLCSVSSKVSVLASLSSAPGHISLLVGWMFVHAVGIARVYIYSIYNVTGLTRLVQLCQHRLPQEIRYVNILSLERQSCILRHQCQW